MKKLKIDLGGHPLTGDDFDFLQTILMEPFVNYLKSYGALVIISGCEFTHASNTITWTAGWVCFNDEVFQIDAGTSNLGVAAIVNGSFSVVETNDAAGDVTYEDTNLVHTYLIRKATIIAGTGTGDALFHRKAVRLKNLSNYYNNTKLTPLGNWIISGSSGITEGLVTLNHSGQVIFSLGVSVSSYNAGTDTKIFTLPAAFRPAYGVTVIAPMITAGSTRTFVHLVIETDGDVIPQGLSGSTAYNIELDGVSFVRSTVYSN